MNDRALIEEIVASMISGIYDKRTAVNTIFKKNISEEDSEKFFNSAIAVFKKMLKLNEVKAINKTRFRQRNDFFTLFQFIYQNQELKEKVLEYQYKILLLIEEHIKPTQDNCIPFKEYALNCVTQSNSKTAREGRIKFFDMLLKNQDPEGSDELKIILEFLEDNYGKDNATELILIDSFYLIDIEKFTI